ncbi:cytochrome p450 monooxygenase GliC [Coniella lustricola]|uniref:Cytochrome p450 monooxygenase GliC n=1 Tax=Coniella lustricola TaxID=2025994 RepID=A0A2T3A684_9PEZI|nr:cytochrome p450 monooxygenase GliC [Coniella lustricola]
MNLLQHNLMFLSFEPSSLSLIFFTAGCTITAFLLIVALKHQAIRKCFGALISRTVNITLLRFFPIKHVDHAASLPSLPYVFPNGQGNVEKFLRGRANSARWASEYGSLYRLWSGISSEVVLTKPAHVEAVFRDSHKHTKAHANDSGFLMDSLLGSCLGLISGQPWNAVRSGVEAPFLRSSMRQYARDAQDFTSAFMHRLQSDNNAFRQQGTLHPVQDLKLLPILFVARVIYGLLTDEQERELRDLIPPRENIFRTVIGGGITRFEFSKFLPLPDIRALKRFKDNWARWNDRVHANAVKRASKADPAPVIAMYKAVEDGKMTREQLLQTLDEILFANIDVTMGGLSWTLVFLAAHPDVQAALRSEIQAQCSSSGEDDENISARDNRERDAYLLSAWTATPTLLGACILEAARLRPLAAFSVPQACPSVRVLDGFEIPAGTNFIIDSYALNIRDPFWGPDRDRFRPERWLERHKYGRDLRYRYWRFGFGPRTCLGKYLAELIVRTVVVEVLENWKIALQPTRPDVEQKGIDKENASNTSTKANDVDDGMSWPWDDELWIHSPQLLLKCEPLKDYFTKERENISLQSSP